MFFRKFISVFLFCSLLLSNLALVGFAQQSPKLPEGVTKGASIGGVNEYNLKNGLKILLIPDQSRQNATVNIVYHVGSRHEGYGETGMAHLLEHLVFKGTPKYGNIPAELTKRGMAPNGTTSLDRTNYFATFPATGDNLEFYLDLEADRMVNSFIARKDLESEFSVVRNEMENGENNPQRVLIEKVFASAYQWHNYGKTTIGARSDVENVKIENLQAFYRKYYQPDNATLIVGGKFDEAKTLEVISQKYGSIPKPTRTLEPTWTSEPPQDGEREVTVRRVGDLKVIMVGYHIPAAADPDFPALAILDRILIDAPSGRLYKALVDTKKANGVLSGNFEQKEPGFAVYAGRLSKDQSIEDAQKILIETVENFAAAPPSKEEVDRQILSANRSLDTLYNDANNIANAMTEWVARGDWRLYFLYRERLNKVTPADVQRVAKSYLIQSNRTVGKFIPTENPVRADIKRLTDEQITAMVKDVKGGEAVAEGEVFDPSPANIEARTKRGNIGPLKTAFLAKKTRGEVVTARISFNFGDAKSLKNLVRTSSFTGQLVPYGTAKRNRQQIKDELDRLKASVLINGNAAGASATITTTRKNLAEVFKLAAELLKEPVFPEAEFEKAKTAALAALEAERSDPIAIASREMGIAFNQAQRGETRYAPTLEEEIADVKAVTLESVKKFYKDFYGASSGELAIVGDFDEKEITPVVTELFGNWKSSKPYTRIPQQFADIPAVKKSFETPDKANAVFFARMGLKMRDDNPDYPALVLGNFIFGGGFLSSRLATRIRQKDGISYSVGSGFSAGSQDEFANFTVQAIYAPENAGRLETAFAEELNKILTNGFTDAEVAEAKQGWLLGRQRSRGNDAVLRSMLAGYLSLNRTMAWDSDFEKKVESLTADQVNAAMKKYINPDKISFFKAGDFAKAKAAAKP